MKTRIIIWWNTVLKWIAKKLSTMHEVTQKMNAGLLKPTLRIRKVCIELQPKVQISESLSFLLLLLHDMNVNCGGWLKRSKTVINGRMQAREQTSADQKWRSFLQKPLSFCLFNIVARYTRRWMKIFIGMQWSVPFRDPSLGHLLSLIQRVPSTYRYFFLHHSDPVLW